MSKPSAEISEVEEIRLLLQQKGLRRTPARIAVLRELRAVHSPLTHSELAERLASFGFDKATVFRNLTDLTDAELLRRTELGDRVWRFEVRRPEDTNNGRHPHFVCVECGSVTCLGDMEFTTASKKRSKEIARITEILIKGHCVKCEPAAGA